MLLEDAGRNGSVTARRTNGVDGREIDTRLLVSSIILVIQAGPRIGIPVWIIGRRPQSGRTADQWIVFGICPLFGIELEAV